MADTYTKTPVDIQKAMARLEARQNQKGRVEQATAPTPAPAEQGQGQGQGQGEQQVQISVAAALEGLLFPGKEYNANHLLAGVGLLQRLDQQVFKMGVPDLCVALEFLLTAWNRTSRYKPAQYAPPTAVSVPASAPASASVPASAPASDDGADDDGATND